MVWGLYITTQELLTLWQLTSAVMTPLPDPTRDAHCLLNKLTGEDDIEAFLGTFEHVVHREGWPIRDWACTNTPHLTGMLR